MVCPGGQALGGYLYVGLSIGAVVAEGSCVAWTSLRREFSGGRLVGKSLARMTVEEDVAVSLLDDQKRLIALNQDGSLTSCSWRDYGEARKIATAILTATTGARGLRYLCRNGQSETAVMLIDGRGAPRISLHRVEPVDTDGWAQDLVVGSLWADFGLIIG